MNKEQTAKAINVMQAFVDGAEIEWKPKWSDEDNWKPVRDPVWSFGVDKYRIKTKAREFWLNTMDNTIHDCDRPGGAHSLLDSRWVKVREVIDND